MPYGHSKRSLFQTCSSCRSARELRSLIPNRFHQFTVLCSADYYRSLFSNHFGPVFATARSGKLRRSYSYVILMKTLQDTYRPQQTTCYILGFTNFIITKNTPTRLVYRHFMTQEPQQLRIKLTAPNVEQNHDTENMHTYWTHEQANGIMDRSNKCACIHSRV